MPESTLLRVLATSLLAGEIAPGPALARAEHTFGRDWRWLGPVVRRYVRKFAGGTRPRHREVFDFLLQDPGCRRALQKHARHLHIAGWLNPAQEMQPVRAAANWDVPPIPSVAALQDRLLLTGRELDWFADLKGLAAKTATPQLRHYHYKVLEKKSGGKRLIEAPKTLMKQLQRQILEEILDKIPTHPAGHGFVQNRSVASFAGPHVGTRVVLRMDLEDFFPSFPLARIESFFRTAGYPEPVAGRLGALCTSSAPGEIWRAVSPIYSRRHLPQGAPSSPSLANLCFYRADCRLTGLAKAAGAAYTRYGDDLAFSGDDEFAHKASRFSLHVAAIIREEGLNVNHRKTRVMRGGVRQHLAGLVVNQCLNVSRTDFDRLKATLTNCVRLGPESQNHSGRPQFRAHLQGRIAFVDSIHSGKGQRLQSIFDRIEWNILSGK